MLFKNSLAMNSLVIRSTVSAFQAFAALIAVSVSSLNHTASGDDWTCWRGAAGDNHASPTTKVPATWNLATGENIVWKTPLSGRGHSSPIVVGDAIFLTTSDEAEQTQSLVKLDRQSGRLLDQWVVHRGRLPEEIHNRNTYASPTPAFDGNNIIVVFHQYDSIVATAMTPNGQQFWQTRVGEFLPARFQFGYGASPLVVGNLVIIASEYDGKDSGLYAFDTGTGKKVWMAPRKSNLNFASPILGKIDGKPSVLLAGAETLTGYDPVSGKPQWSVDTTTEAICGTCVWDGNRVLVSGGNPASGTWCVTGGVTSKLEWDNRVKCYEQSLLALNGYVVGFADSGVVYCWRTSDGKEMWRSRLSGGGVSSSPLLADGRIIMAAEDGTMYVIAATPERFELLHEARTGDSIFASPVAIDNRLLVRTGVRENGKIQEYLVAIGER
jgi:outer membrane protein assembly factor BamB